jgi:hypothetical protein
MPAFLSTTYTEVAGKGKNPSSFKAEASGYKVGPGGSLAFGEQVYHVAEDGSVRRLGRSKMSKKFKRKLRAALKAEMP